MKLKETKQIKSLIKRAIDMLGKNGSSINISNIEDCSKFISNLFGFSGWQEIKKLSAKSYEKDDNILELKSYIKPVIDINLYDKEFTLRKRKNTKFKSKIFPHSINLKEDIDFATHYSHDLKIDTNLFLKSTHTVFIGDNIESSLKINFENTLKKAKNSFISLSDKSNITLDPWSSMIRSNSLENFLSFSNDNFSIFWCQVIRDLYISEYVISLKEIISFFELNNFIALKNLLKKINMPSYIYLEKHLWDLDIVEKINENISKEKHDLHWKKIENTFNLLSSLEDMYKSGIFVSLFGEDELLNMMEKRENIQISNKYNNFPLYQKIIQLELERVFDVYNNSIDLYERDYKYWLIIDDLKKWDYASFNWAYKLLTTIVIVFSKPGTDSLNNSIINSSQIIIMKSNTIDFSIEAKNFLLDNVRVWPEDFWYNQMDIMKDLNNKEAFYIYADLHSHEFIDFRNFYCKKVNFY